MNTETPLLDRIVTPPGTDLVVIPAAALIFVPGGAEKVLSSIKARAREAVANLDVSRPKDREAMRSEAWRLRRLKTTGDDSGKDLKADLMKQVNPIDAERRVWRSGMDEIIQEIIAPAEEFDAREIARIKAHEDAIAEIANFGALDRDASSERLHQLIDDLDHLHVARQWVEFEGRATTARTNARNALRLALMDAQAREEAEAEARRLHDEETARAQAELERLRAIREAEIARQAAETATLAAEQAAAEEAARIAWEAQEAADRAEQAAMRADYHRRMLQHVKNCGFGFIDEQPQPLGILQHELTAKIKYDEENFGDLLSEALVARDEALKAIQRSIDEANRRAAQEEAAAAALTKAKEDEARAAAALLAEQERAARLEAEKEAARIKNHQEQIAIVRSLAIVKPDTPAAHIAARNTALEDIDQSGRDWEEFTAQAITEIGAAATTLRHALEEAQTRESAEAERQQKLADGKTEAIRLATIAEEQKRAEGIRIQQEVAAHQREQNIAHQRRINRAAADDLIEHANLTTEQAEAVVKALAKKLIRHCGVSY